MIKYKQRDVILVDFGFSEGMEIKRRPALIISSDKYNKGRQEVIIAAITHNIKRVLFGDIKIDRWKESGLIYPSLVTGIARTIKGNMILRKLGVFSWQDFRKVQDNFRAVMGIT